MLRCSALYLTHLFALVGIDDNSSFGIRRDIFIAESLCEIRFECFVGALTLWRHSATILSEPTCCYHTHWQLHTYTQLLFSPTHVNKSSKVMSWIYSVQKKEWMMNKPTRLWRWNYWRGHWALGPCRVSPWDSLGRSVKLPAPIQWGHTKTILHSEPRMFASSFFCVVDISVMETFFLWSVNVLIFTDRVLAMRIMQPLCLISRHGKDESQTSFLTLSNYSVLSLPIKLLTSFYLISFRSYFYIIFYFNL